MPRQRRDVHLPVLGLIPKPASRCWWTTILGRHGPKVDDRGGRQDDSSQGQGAPGGGAGGQEESQLRTALQVNHTFDELLQWARDIEDDKDRENAIVAIEVAKRANDKGHIARTLLPCRRAIFLGIVAPNQPPVAVTSPFGLNHARVIVEGVVHVYNFGLVADHDEKRMPLAGHLTVCGTKVGRIVDGRCILTRSGIVVRPTQATTAATP